jgi:hypothetical protein
MAVASRLGSLTSEMCINTGTPGEWHRNGKPSWTLIDTSPLFDRPPVAIPLVIDFHRFKSGSVACHLNSDWTIKSYTNGKCGIYRWLFYLSLCDTLYAVQMQSDEKVFVCPGDSGQARSRYSDRTQQSSSHIQHGHDEIHVIMSTIRTRTRAYQLSGLMVSKRDLNWKHLPDQRSDQIKSNHKTRIAVMNRVFGPIAGLSQTRLLAINSPPNELQSTCLTRCLITCWSTITLVNPCVTGFVGNLPSWIEPGISPFHELIGIITCRFDIGLTFLSNKCFQLRSDIMLNLEVTFPVKPSCLLASTRRIGLAIKANCC